MTSARQDVGRAWRRLGAAWDRRPVIEIEDDGRAFNPLDAPGPDLSASLMDREPGGLGIHLARSLMDQIFYQRVGQRNLLTLTKRIHRASAPAS